MSPRRLSADFIFWTNSPNSQHLAQGLAVHNLGQTRSSRKLDHLLLTPDTFVRTPLPGMNACTAVVHVGPAIGAAFSQYTAEFESSGELGSTGAQRFIYVLEGAVQVEVDGKLTQLAPRGYAFFEEGAPHRIAASKASRVEVIEKSYQSVPGESAPKTIISTEDAIASHPLSDDPDLQVKCLLPDEPSFDFAVNTMTYQPGAALSM